jgi:hypothetical protein
MVTVLVGKESTMPLPFREKRIDMVNENRGRFMAVWLRKVVNVGLTPDMYGPVNLSS